MKHCLKVHILAWFLCFKTTCHVFLRLHNGQPDVDEVSGKKLLSGVFAVVVSKVKHDLSHASWYSVNVIIITTFHYVQFTLACLCVLLWPQFFLLIYLL